MECGICYFSFEKEEFFELRCCKNNHVCKSCLDLLITPLCPFCRARIEGLEGKRASISYEPPSSMMMGGNSGFFSSSSLPLIDPLDDMYTDSRILRRQMKRLRKLQERERDRLHNRNLSFVMRENKKKTKARINREIEEDQSFFMEEENNERGEEEDDGYEGEEGFLMSEL